jgi:formamidopyrimidine-DNA glycosylase
MPELPEVETIRQDLDKELVGKTVLDVVASTPKVLQPSLEAVRKAIKGKKIRSFERKGKLLIVRLSGGKTFRARRERRAPSVSGGCTLGIHLRMTGRLLIRDEGCQEDEYQRAVLKLSDGVELRFADLRLFGYIKLFKDQEAVEEALSKIGPEPLSGDINPDKFYQIIQKTSRPIKVAIMDQKLISGIGNIYANDALFEAGIHPRTKANQLTRGQATKLYEAIEQVLKESLAARGATIADEMYRDAHGRRGHYEQKVRVYQQEGKPCPRCGTPIKRITLGGRGTFFCPKCQK